MAVQGTDGELAAASGSSDDEAAIAAELCAGVTAGRAGAEDAFVRRYRTRLVFVLRQRTRDPELSEDLAHEALAVVIQRLRGEGLEDPTRLYGFLHRTALNLLRNERRKVQRRRTDADERIEAHADSAPGPLRYAVQASEVALAEQLLGELGNPRDRELLMRYYVLEHDKPEICAALGLSSAHFNRVLYRARKRSEELLRTRMDPGDLGPPEGE